MAFKDLRRTDARDDIQGQTFWRTSAEMNITTSSAGSYVVDSFPNAAMMYIIDMCAMDVITDLNAGTVTIGHGTLPTDTTAESGTLTTTSADNLWATALGDETTSEIFNIYSLSTAGTLDPLVFIGAATSVPVIIATVTTAASGIFRCHYRISCLPAYATKAQ